MALSANHEPTEFDVYTCTAEDTCRISCDHSPWSDGSRTKTPCLARSLQRRCRNSFPRERRIFPRQKQTGRGVDFHSFSLICLPSWLMLQVLVGSPACLSYQKKGFPRDKSAPQLGSAGILPTVHLQLSRNCPFYQDPVEVIAISHANGQDLKWITRDIDRLHILHSQGLIAQRAHLGQNSG